MLTTTDLIQIAIEDTIQQLPSVPKGTATNRFLLGRTLRGPLLPPHGTRQREHKLLAYYWDDYNLIFRSANSGITKKIQSTPWEIQGESKLVKLYQNVLLNADFGCGWDSFVSKILTDYHRADGGAYIELIGRGDPRKPLTGAVTGLATLDTMRCLPTGDPEYPIIYMDDIGALHELHHTRVIRFLDMPDGYELARGYGECALSRGIAAVYRDILINRYVQQVLDDNPPPGFVLFKNITDQKLQEGIATMEKERGTDTGGKWGRTVRIFGLHAETTPEIEFVSFTAPPEKFDFEVYKNINVKEIALAFGVDVQELWELTGGNIGTATQSEVLHQKSKGKAIGRILKTLERVINQVLPESLAFEFQYQDPDEDQDQATLAQTWINNALQIQTLGAPQEIVMQLLANQVSAIRDVVTDEEGQLRLPDIAMTPEEAGVVTPDVDEQVVPDASIEEDKALSTVQAAFRKAFVRMGISAQHGVMKLPGIRTALRAMLQEQGSKAYIDGLRDGGAESLEMTPERKRDISAWRTQQSAYVSKFAETLASTEMTREQIASRADMWTHRSINPVYYMGLAEANKDQRYQWVVDPRKEHCKTCLAMNGQVHKLKDYIKSGILPQSPLLECGGYKCGCSLKRVEGRSRGRIPGTPGRIGTVIGRIATGIRRLFGG